MHRNTWKQRERRNASLFGALRNPLSGGNSGHSRSDSRHPHIFLECKHSKAHAVWTVHDKAKKLARKEKKTPVIALTRMRSPGVILCIHTDNINAFIREWQATNPPRPRKRKKGRHL